MWTVLAFKAGANFSMEMATVPGGHDSSIAGDTRCPGENVALEAPPLALIKNL